MSDSQSNSASKRNIWVALGALTAGASLLMIAILRRPRGYNGGIVADVETIKKLYKACEDFDVESARKYIQIWKERNYLPLAAGKTPLHAACIIGELTLIQELVEKKICDVNASFSSSGTDGITALHLATEMGHIRAVRLLIRLGANVNAQFSNGQTPLMSACKGGHEDVVIELLRAHATVSILMDGVTCLEILMRQALATKCTDVLKAVLKYAGPELDVNTTSIINDDQTPLICLAAEGGFDEIIQVLVERGCRLDVSSSDARTPLIHALVNRNHSTAKLLLDLGDSAFATDILGATTVTYAVAAGFPDILIRLLREGVNANAVFSVDADRKAVVLNLCADSGLLEMLKILLEFGANVNPVGVYEAPILGAVKSGHLDVLNELLKHGANIRTDIDNPDSHSPLQMAIMLENFPIIEVLLNSGQIDINENIHGDQEFMPALHFAAKKGSIPVMKFLLAHGSKVNQQDPRGLTALCRATQAGVPDAVNFLIANGADVSIPTEDGTTALHYASACPKDILPVLIEHGADVNCASTSGIQGATPLHIACEFGILKWVNLLLEKGADPNAALANQQTTIVTACAPGRAEIVKTLIKAGADTRLSAISTLQVAVLTGDIDVVKAVLEGNPDINLREDTEGNTALHYAYQIGNLPIIRVLENAGSDPEILNNNGISANKYIKTQQ